MIRTLGWYFQIARQIYGPTRREVQRLTDELQPRIPGATYLDRGRQKRIFQYAAVGTLLVEALTRLQGRRCTAAEHRALSYLSLLAPTVDDLCDEERLTEAQILRVLQGNLPAARPSGQLARALFLGLTQTLGAEGTARLEGYGVQLLAAQQDSLAQLRAAPLDEATLQRITYQKGATSLWLYRALLPEPITSAEEKALGSVGYLVQWINDLFDVYKDRAKGQQTLFTCGADLRQREQEFLAQMDRLQQELEALPYPPAQVRNFWHSLTLLLGRGQVGLEQLRRLQGDQPQLGDLWRYSRAELVVDMEKASNFWAAWKHTRRWQRAYGLRSNASVVQAH